MSKKEIKFKKNRKYRTIKNIPADLPKTGSPGTKVGDKIKIITVRDIQEDGHGRKVIISKNSRYYEHELEPNVENIEKLERKIGKKVKEIKELENKIKFMKENDLDEYSDEKYQAYKIIQESSKEEMSDVEKIEKVSELLK